MNPFRVIMLTNRQIGKSSKYITSAKSGGDNNNY